MKKLFLITLTLLFLSSPSFGEWKEIDSDNDGVIFIEADTLRNKENLVYFNALTDFYEPQFSSKTVLSTISRMVIDCRNRKIKYLRTVWFKGSMGRGEIDAEFGSYDWIEDGWEKGSIHDLYYKFVC